MTDKPKCNIDMAHVVRLLSEITHLCLLLADDRIYGAELSIDNGGGWEAFVPYRYAARHDRENFFQCGGTPLSDLVRTLEAEIAGLTLKTQEEPIP